MPPVKQEREEAFSYHHDFVSVAGDYIIEQIANNTNSGLIDLYKNESNVAFIQANGGDFSIAPRGTVYQLRITAIDVAQFDLHWKTHSDGVRHYNSAVTSYMVKWDEQKWTDAAVQDAQSEFGPRPSFQNFKYYFLKGLTQAQKDQLERSH